MSRRFSRIASGLLALAGLLSSPSALAWWNDDWAFRKELTFDLSAAGANVPANATDVPVLVRLSIANFPYFADARPDGADLRFIAGDDKTPLTFHVEKFDSQAQIALLWVRLPQLTGGANADRIYLYYGNPEGASAGDPAGTYDKSQAAVYHFAAAGAQDSSANRNEPAAFTAEASPASLIGAGARFDGTKSLAVPASPSLQLVAEQGYTMSAWVRAEGAQTQAVIVSAGEGGRELALGMDGERAFARWRDAGRDVVVAQSQGALTGEWHHLALRATAKSLELLVDGAPAGQSVIALAPIGAGLSVGGAAAASFFRGELDEVQVASTARSDAWLRAAATSQGMVAPLLIYGGDAQKDEGGGHDSYFGSTLRNVTVDGWVIIAVLAVMFLASVAIMAGKALYLSRVASGNRKFIDEFHRMRDDPAALERRESGLQPDTDASAFESGKGSGVMSALESSKSTFGASTIWPLYHHGMRETMKRLDGKSGSADRLTSLSSQSIAAIRATMDASQTRMLQRLQSQMVWLTISISGGPFLGLLGTVVGVMITFAAIAASGEVNVNAIAPGTAAALVATVAGLGVAIPCLFGYNYLNTRIKEINADMRVFVDEFVTRIAETYS